MAESIKPLWLVYFHKAVNGSFIQSPYAAHKIRTNHYCAALRMKLIRPAKFVFL